jgi:hypothetical protein
MAQTSHKRYTKILPHSKTPSESIFDICHILALHKAIQKLLKNTT